MNVFKRSACVAFLLVSVVCLASAKDKPVQIESLYDDFVEADYSTLDLPQYQQTILIQGVVLAIEDDVFGEPGQVLLSLGSESDGDELARLVFDSGDSLKKVKIGQTIVVEAEMSFASGTEYIPFGNCTLK